MDKLVQAIDFNTIGYYLYSGSYVHKVNKT